VPTREGGHKVKVEGHSDPPLSKSLWCLQIDYAGQCARKKES